MNSLKKSTAKLDRTVEMNMKKGLTCSSGVRCLKKQENRSYILIIFLSQPLIREDIFRIYPPFLIRVRPHFKDKGSAGHKLLMRNPGSC